MDISVERGGSLLLGFRLAFRMGCVNSAGPGVADCATSGTGRHRQASSASAVASAATTIPPFHELHGKEGDLFIGQLNCVDVVDLDNGGVVDLASRASLAMESLDKTVILGEVPGEHFQGDESIKADLPRPVDGSHSALTNTLDHLEARDRLADEMIVDLVRKKSK